MFLACSFLQKKLYILLDNLELCTKKASEAFNKGNFINLVNVSNNLQTNTIIYTSSSNFKTLHKIYCIFFSLFVINAFMLKFLRGISIPILQIQNCF